MRLLGVVVSQPRGRGMMSNVILEMATRKWSIGQLKISPKPRLSYLYSVIYLNVMLWQ
ncbi:hypothetical protein CsSME_00021753 [Camellia sinensis var. sinensis]